MCTAVVLSLARRATASTPTKNIQIKMFDVESVVVPLARVAVRAKCSLFGAYLKGPCPSGPVTFWIHIEKYKMMWFD